MFPMCIGLKKYDDRNDVADAIAVWASNDGVRCEKPGLVSPYPPSEAIWCTVCWGSPPADWYGPDALGLPLHE